MTTYALVGAGPGLGLAAARRFAREGFAVALLSRDAGRSGALAASLEGTAAGFAADVTDPDALAAALHAAAEQLGPIEVLQYSPAVASEFMKPVLDAAPGDLAGPLAFSVTGPIAAARAVLPGMRERGRGTILLVNGGTAVTPHPDRAGTSIAFAAGTAWAAMLHERLAPEGVHVAQLVIPGAIEPGHPRKDPAVLADRLWAMHRDRDGFRVFAEDA